MAGSPASSTAAEMPSLKLRIGGSVPATPTTPSASTPSGPKLSFKRPAQDAIPTSAASEKAAASDKPPERKKRKYTKRDPAAKAAAKAKKEAAAALKSKKGKKTAGKLKLSVNTNIEGGAKLLLKSGVPLTAKTPGTGSLKIVAPGLVPKRPVGVGYDSEASDAEDDPAIESQFILRMQPGTDCDVLLAAIENKTIGKSDKEGGIQVSMKFFDKEGRRTMINIKGKKYAACMVDLPCVVESMKSWDKRGWWKSADICQMMLVLGQVTKEDEAKNYPLPREVDKETYEYPHGLTPPMHYVRKRRFRKRVSHRTIAKVEEEVERLLAEDDKWEKQHGYGSVVAERVDLAEERRREKEAERGQDEDEEMGDEEDAQFEEDAEAEYDFEEDGEEEDTDALAAEMEAELGGEFEDDDEDAEGEMADDADDGPPSGSAANSPAPGHLAVAATPATQPTSGDDEGEDDDDDDDDDDELDEDQLEAQQANAQAREEIADLEREIQSARAQMDSQHNLLLKSRLATRVQNLENDLKLRKAQMGLDDDDE